MEVSNCLNECFKDIYHVFSWDFITNLLILVFVPLFPGMLSRTSRQTSIRPQNSKAARSWKSGSAVSWTCYGRAYQRLMVGNSLILFLAPLKSFLYLSKFWRTGQTEGPLHTPQHIRVTQLPNIQLVPQVCPWYPGGEQAMDTWR